MNFIWFILGLVVWGWVFWNFIFLILSIPSVGILKLIDFFSERKQTAGAIVLLSVTVFFAFIFGTLIPCLIYGGGLGLIALIFSAKASFPLIYLIITGLGAFYIVAPSGESNILGMIISLVSYVLVVNVPAMQNLMKTVLVGFLALFHGVFSVLVPIIIAVLVWGWFTNRLKGHKDKANGGVK